MSFSAFMCGCGISIGQKEVGEKINEIPEIPKLLDLIDITDCTITIDAIGTQKDIMDTIIDKGGHFCLQLKKNQRTAFEDVDLFFNDLGKNHKKEFKIPLLKVAWYGANVLVGSLQWETAWKLRKIAEDRKLLKLNSEKSYNLGEVFCCLMNDGEAKGLVITYMESL